MSQCGRAFLAVGLILAMQAVLAAGGASATTASFAAGPSLGSGSIVAIGDFDGDGDRDVVAAHEFFLGGNVLRVVWNSGAHPAEFTSSQSLGSAGLALATAHIFPGLPRDDIVVADSASAIVVWHWNGASFVPTSVSATHGASGLDVQPLSESLIYYAAGTSTGYIRWAGGFPDVSLGTSALAEGFRRISRCPSCSGVATAGDAGTLFVVGAHYTVNATPSYDVEFGDVDRNGTQDLVVARDTQLVWHGCTIALVCTSAPTAITPVDTLRAWRDVEVGDVDLDGDLDVVAVDSASTITPLGAGSIWWYENNGQATPSFTEHRLVSAGIGNRNPFRSVALGDLDGDGDLDAAWGGDADNPFYSRAATQISRAAFWWEDGLTGTGLGKAVAGGRDLNRDGWPDALVASGSTVGVYLGTSTGLADTAVWTAVGAQTTESFGDALGFGDWNADGFVDVAIGAPTYLAGCNQTYGEKVGRVYIWNGGPADVSNPSGLGDSGTPANADRLLGPPQTFSNMLCYTPPGLRDGFGTELVTMDRNGDGIDDLVVADPGLFHDECGPGPNATTGRGQVVLHRGSTAGLTYLEQIEGERCRNVTQCRAGSSASCPFHFAEGIAAGDFNSGTRDDLAVSGEIYVSGDFDIGANIFYDGEPAVGGSGELLGQEIVIPGTDVESLAAADTNNDGFDDLVLGAIDQWPQPDQGLISFAHGAAGGLTLTPWLLQTPSVWPHVVVGSARQQNRDCYEDVALSTSDALRVFRGQAGTAGPVTTPIETISKPWSSLASAGDARRDGVDDLLVGGSTVFRYVSNGGGAAALYQGDANTTPAVPDCDGDGTLRNLDCNDRDPAIEPGAAEVCNLHDDDCDNLIDEGLGCNFTDADGDAILDDGNHSGAVGDAPCAGGSTQNCDDNCRFIANASQVDGDADSYGDSCDNCPTIANATQADGAGGLEVPSDGVGDSCDNCLRVNNPRVAADFLMTNSWATLTGGQRDDDHDGYGNKCDGDFTDGGALTGTPDLTQWRASNGKSRALDVCGTSATQPCARYDLDEEGALIGTPDLTVWRRENGTAAGPKCAACTGAGSVPLPCTAGAAGTCGPIP